MKQITAVGVDVSKGRSMIAVRQPGGVILAAPFKVNHTATELNQLVQMLRQYPGEVRIVMEHTGPYWRPIALALVNGGFFVSVVNAMLIHDFHDNSLRRVKTDKADALKIANYALTCHYANSNPARLACGVLFCCDGKNAINWDL